MLKAGLKLELSTGSLYYILFFETRMTLSDQK